MGQGMGVYDSYIEWRLSDMQDVIRKTHISIIDAAAEAEAASDRIDIFKKGLDDDQLLILVQDDGDPLRDVDTITVSRTQARELAHILSEWAGSDQ